jgi:dihydroxyacetone kinase-like predicted kinase
MRDKRIHVLNSRSVAECYASLSVIDFDDCVERAVAESNEAISGIFEFGVYHAVKDIKYGNVCVPKGHFFSLKGKSILGVAQSIEEVSLRTLSEIAKNREVNALTLFTGENISGDFTEELFTKIEGVLADAEMTSVCSDDKVYSLLFMLY